MLVQGNVGPQTNADGSLSTYARTARTGELVVSDVMPRYYELASRGNLFVAHAIITAPVIYSTAAGTGGPLLWNNSQGTNAVILGIGFGVSVVTTVAASIGCSGGTAQTAAPTSTTAIDTGPVSTKLGAPTPRSNVYRVGTPTAATFFMPYGSLHTGALTTDTEGTQWIDVGGSIVVPYQNWFSAMAASATTTTTVMAVSLLWTEVPA